MHPVPLDPELRGADEPTADYHAGSGSGESPAARIHKALVPRPERRGFGEETHTLFTQHLLLINVILAAVVALVAVPFVLLHVVRTRDGPSLAPPLPFGVAWLLLAVWTLLAAALWSRWPLPGSSPDRRVYQLRLAGLREGVVTIPSSEAAPCSVSPARTALGPRSWPRPWDWSGSPWSSSMGYSSPILLPLRPSRRRPGLDPGRDLPCRRCHRRVD